MLLKDLAYAAGEKPEVVRYYARIGLVRCDSRDLNGYRRFAAREVERIRFIRSAQACGFTLGDIRVLLDNPQSGSQRCCTQTRDRLQSRLVGVRHEVARLECLIGRMEVLLNNWEERGCGRDQPARCPVVRGETPLSRYTAMRGAAPLDHEPACAGESSDVDYAEPYCGDPLRRPFASSGC
ncbi:MAG: MerR family transcriptional regulator [Gammaproteobacteria bacterium]